MENTSIWDSLAKADEFIQRLSILKRSTNRIIDHLINGGNLIKALYLTGFDFCPKKNNCMGV